MELGRGDRRALANRIAQALVDKYSIVSDAYMGEIQDYAGEHEVTALIDHEINEFLGEIK